MCHIGFACFSGGWGIKNKIREIGTFEWLKKSAESGNSSGMANYSFMLKYGYGVNLNDELSNIWAQKALGKYL